MSKESEHDKKVEELKNVPLIELIERLIEAEDELKEDCIIKSGMYHPATAEPACVFHHSCGLRDGNKICDVDSDCDDFKTE